MLFSAFGYPPMTIAELADALLADVSDRLSQQPSPGGDSTSARSLAAVLLDEIGRQLLQMGATPPDPEASHPSGMGLACFVNDRVANAAA